MLDRHAYFLDMFKLLVAVAPCALQLPPAALDAPLLLVSCQLSPKVRAVRRNYAFQAKLAASS